MNRDTIRNQLLSYVLYYKLCDIDLDSVIETVLKLEASLFPPSSDEDVPF